MESLFRQPIKATFSPQYLVVYEPVAVWAPTGRGMEAADRPPVELVVAAADVARTPGEVARRESYNRGLS